MSSVWRTSTNGVLMEISEEDRARELFGRYQHGVSNSPQPLSWEILGREGIEYGHHAAQIVYPTFSARSLLDDSGWT